MLALELAGVSKRYGTRRALRDVNLVVPQGRALGQRLNNLYGVDFGNQFGQDRRLIS